jgi:hypothetical protein
LYTGHGGTRSVSPGQCLEEVHGARELRRIASVVA